MLREDDNQKMKRILSPLLASTITEKEAERIIDIVYSRIRPGSDDQFIRRTAAWLNAHPPR